MYEQNREAPNKYMTGTNSILVTVLIPTRNRNHLLERTLLSVVKNAVKNMEVLVVDNNADPAFSNAAQKTLQNFERSYPDIAWQYLHSPKPFAAGARNDGLKIAKGQFVCLLDDDDELLDNSIKIRVQHLLNNADLALLYCANEANIYPYPFKMYRYYKYDKVRHSRGLMMMSCSSIIINKKIFTDNSLFFDERLRRMEDYDLCRRLIELNLKVKSIPDALVQINMHPDTRLSSNTLGNTDFKQILLRKWGNEVGEYLDSYGEGLFIWRKCFGIETNSYADIIKMLSEYMDRRPSFSFKLKYLMVSVSPVLFLGLYHLLIIISQFYKNTILPQTNR
jgi:glycosyltransferase involved in cell wall biosynthesis